MVHKYGHDSKVTFVYKGRKLTGIIQGCKEGPEPMYMVWIQNKYGWIRESMIIKTEND